MFLLCTASAQLLPNNNNYYYYFKNNNNNNTEGFIMLESHTHTLCLECLMRKGDMLVTVQRMQGWLQ